MTAAIRCLPAEPSTDRDGVGPELSDDQAGRWLSALGHLLEIVILIDPAGVVQCTTASVAGWLGLTAAELVGAPLQTLSHPDDGDALKQAFVGCTAAEPRHLVHRVRAADGSWRLVESTLVCLRSDPLLGGAVLLAGRDVTERITLEQERERHDLHRRVSARMEAVGQLSAGIAHEINTPLQYVGDSVTFLKEAVNDLLWLTDRYREALNTDIRIPIEQRRANLQVAEETADVEYLCERIPAAFVRTEDGLVRVRSIVQAMKRFSHTSSTTEAAPADINDAIETTLAVCRNAYKYVAEVSCNLGELPAVSCNIDELNQVFLNLIINASQAVEEKVRPPGTTGRIDITTRAGDGEVSIRIADNGPGVPPELLDRIYEPFFTTKEVGKGTGQGLALARAIVQRHRGSLECESVPGEGATFTIRLPTTTSAADNTRSQA